MIPRIQADAVLDLDKWAKEDVLHVTREEAEAAALADANWLEFEVGTIYVRWSGCPTGDYKFDPPVRARVYDVNIDRWMDSEFLDPLVDFVFLDPVPENVFDRHEDGKQYGWWYSRTHRRATDPENPNHPNKQEQA